MTTQEILKLCGKGEQTPVQMKERVTDAYELGKEMVCYANERGGGLIIIGVNDKTGKVNALSRTEVQEQTGLLSQIATDQVHPAVSIKAENVDVPGGQLIAVTVLEGINKPYKDNKGVVWVKNGANKRRIVDNAEIAEMMSDSGTFRQDEAIIPGATIADLDMNVVKTYLIKRFEASYKSKDLTYEQIQDASADELVSLAASGMTVERLLKNFGLIRSDGGITYAAMLLFGRHPWRWLPTATVKCVSFIGNSLGGTEFRDKMDDLDADGALPGGLEVEDVLSGTSLPRNKMLFTHGAFLLPYSGIGSGFLRARELDDKMEVVNDTKKKEVIVTFWRGSNQERVRVTEFGNGVTKKSNGAQQKVTESSNGVAPSKVKLPGKEQDIINFCTVPRTAAEILSRMGLTNQTKNRKKHINPLVEQGRLKLTIPDKPNDPNQKYVKA